MQLLELNDKCLISILEKMSLVDLIVITTTCRRFRNLALLAFQLNKEFASVDLPRLHRQLESTGEMKFYFKEFFTNFGSSLKKVVWCRARNNQQTEIESSLTFQRMTVHCSNLEELRLRDFGLSEQNAPSAKQLFSQLKKITLIHCFHWLSLLAESSNCEELQIWGGPGSIHHLNFDLPKLKSCQFRMSNMDSTTISCIEHFLLRHKNLTALDLDVAPTMNLSFLGELKSLQKLEVRMFEELQPDQQTQLQNMKIPKELCLGYNVIAFLNSLTAPESLEQLKICAIQIDDRFINALKRFPNLRLLTLRADVYGSFDTLNCALPSTKLNVVNFSFKWF